MSGGESFPLTCTRCGSRYSATVSYNDAVAQLAAAQARVAELESKLAAREEAEQWYQLEHHKTVAELTNRAEKAEKERDHWKANHDNQLAIKRAVLDRPDLADQSKSVQALIAERDAARARAAVDGYTAWQAVADLTGCGKLHGAQGPAPSIAEMCAALVAERDEVATIAYAQGRHSRDEEVRALIAECERLKRPDPPRQP